MVLASLPEHQFDTAGRLFVSLKCECYVYLSQVDIIWSEEMSELDLDDLALEEGADEVSRDSADKAKIAASKDLIKTGRHRVRMTSMNDATIVVKEVDDVTLHEGEHEGEVVHEPVVKGEFTKLPSEVQQFIAEYVSWKYSTGWRFYRGFSAATKYFEKTRKFKMAFTPMISAAPICLLTRNGALKGKM